MFLPLRLTGEKINKTMVNVIKLETLIFGNSSKNDLNQMCYFWKYYPIGKDLTALGNL